MSSEPAPVPGATPGTRAGRRRARRPLWARRPVLIGGGVVLALAAGALVGVQVRAAQARDTERVTSTPVAAPTPTRATPTADPAVLTSAAAADALRRAAWDAVLAEANAAIAAAGPLLAESEGEVADDAVRLSLAAAIERVTAAAAAELSTAQLTLDLAALVAASDAVGAARAAWQAEQAVAPPVQVGGPPSTGAGADCGGPESREGPDDSGGASFYTSTPTAEGDGTNGNVPASAMSPLGWCQDSQGNQQWLRADAAAAMTRLNEAFRAQFGENVAIDLSYRSYADQVAMRAYFGSLAARPGTSNHGWGTAIDTWEWAAYGFGTPRYEWLVANGPTYGWVAPDWARQGGSNPEYWHFEYVG